MHGEPYRSPEALPPSGPTSGDLAMRLGVRRSVHRPPPFWRSLLPATMVFIGVLLGCAMSATVAVLPVALLLGVVGSALTARGPLGRRGVRLEVHAHGVVVVTPNAREVILFQDVDAVWYEVRRAAGFAQIQAFCLIDHDGVSHRVPLVLEDAVGAANWILRHCSEPLISDARAALRAGESLTFGEIRIDRDTITVGKRAPVTWKEVRCAHLRSGSIALFRRMPFFAWRTVRMDRIPHPMVFARLVRDLVPRVKIDKLPGSTAN